ncbi:MAG: HAMP domain-containing histidine kinase [Flavobacteriaceae bacterium]|jgi:nitrogen fixation/metabolism regulation signal transduction histidine kinase|nr:HAMP domain-containing histidine kinase [Flavobacteriaceae bacterium]MBT4297408.1 HAMP domain-containing histidine kinase [Flavobacteriaceae bacterium]MBT5233013.1 HAMP domain-containing histidine kinase [Flavobacteriaceae bacterium]MBT5493873.1 HAMP domain-containing histidine kinase [Flavobacteriaceae bacterium]MBT6653851.1 HAMP domain-containing histidine kinase [Flavobacteriaceae bacterium]
MTVIVVATFVLISLITIPQFKTQSEKYHSKRLERKEAQIQRSIAYFSQETSTQLNPKKLDSILSEKIYQVSDVQSVKFSIYSLDGNLINSTLPKNEISFINKELLNKILSQKDSKIIEITQKDQVQYRSSFSLILDDNFNPLWILNLPYYDDDNLNSYELESFLIILGEVYFFLFILSIIISYFVSQYMTKAISEIALKMKQTRLDKRNSKIKINARSKEVKSLVESYNNMVDMLDKNVKELSKSNKEQAWREMAKQVAHEIKNPLTPMKLSVQSFERDFRNDKKNKDKVEDFSQTIIQQIDTMSSIASAFSNFAEMPTQQGEKLNIVKAVRLSLEIFKEKHIVFKSNEDKIIINIDRPQIVRIMTNLIKNAVQACENTNSPSIKVSIKKMSKTVSISVRDNGNGIPLNIRKNIFEPNFTTKSGGMGLGLGMVKNLVNSYEGKIDFESKVNKGTTFKITFPTLD